MKTTREEAGHERTHRFRPDVRHGYLMGLGTGQLPVMLDDPYLLLVLRRQSGHWRNATYSTSCDRPLNSNARRNFQIEVKKPAVAGTNISYRWRKHVARVNPYLQPNEKPQPFPPPLLTLSLASPSLRPCIIAPSVSSGIVHTARPGPVRAHAHMHTPRRHAPSLTLGLGGGGPSFQTHC